MPKSEPSEAELGKKEARPGTGKEWDPMTDCARNSHSSSFYDIPQQREHGPGGGPS